MFKVGDRVRRINKDHPYGITVGSLGTVDAVNTEEAEVTVKWDAFTIAEGEYNQSFNLELIQTQAERNKEIDIALHNGTKPTNPKDRAATHRLDLSLFPETARVFGAVAMTEGDSKYGGYNYRVAGVKVSTYKAALDRHMGKYFDQGEWADAKTGVPHLANAIACIAVLIDGHVKGNITDDRPPVAPDLYTWGEALSKSLHEMFPNGPERCTELKDGNNDGCVPDWLTSKP